MRARILLTGDELVEGRLQDSNGFFLAQAMTELGYEVDALELIGDDMKSLVQAFERALNETDAVVVSGGLGGTADDLSRHVAAQVLGEALEQKPDALEQIHAFWRRMGRPLPKPEPLEAMMPLSAQVVVNALGLAPGILIEKAGARLICLPGVPSELRRMVADGALLKLGKPVTLRRERLFRIVGLPESRIAESLAARLDRGRNPLIGIAAKTGEVQLALRARARTAAEAEALLDLDQDAIREIFGAQLLSVDGRSAEEIVVAELQSRAQSLGVAESLTGGYLGQCISSVPGASTVFQGGVIAYSPAQKVALLGVDPSLTRAETIVSEATARAMAEGLRRRLGVDWACATTGFAGPARADEDDQVGLAWVAVAAETGTWAESRVHPGDRQDVRLRVVNHVLDLLRRRLQADEPDPVAEGRAG